ncbi:OmpH family outer membrane protein [Imperialibacter roseus]|mgnify:CR=1 FL=1|uniref:OmpH family outer membrane protein n=1 Tax=Imperialibacter roseus TaxID=1324217 RepID=A0ABZ0IPD0_9BACT|nr:OmpH family outer membrane protein [Imperialibacter roseus]WOK06431.1 OmpH family outer membrane protein [Imperialibacter roseus]|tara:strand:- start:32722 stop:33249 length:528 start_codon:yes stop_codon:yes gene_type:complete
MKLRSLLFGVFVLFAVSVTAQELKVGYTNVDYILTQMPESKQIEADLKAYETQLQNRLQAKIQEFQTKGQAFQSGYQTMTDIERADKQEELQNLQASIEKFQRDAQQSMQDKELQLLQPAYDKIQKAIDDVAKENGFTHVFRSEALLFAKDSDEISNIVLQKMGITPKTTPTGGN